MTALYEGIISTGKNNAVVLKGGQAAPMIHAAGKENPAGAGEGCRGGGLRGRVREGVCGVSVRVGIKVGDGCGRLLEGLLILPNYKNKQC
jgi:hypothetical protein